MGSPDERSTSDSLVESPELLDINGAAGWSPSMGTTMSSLDAQGPQLVGGTSATSTPGGGATPGSRMAAMMAAGGGDCTVTYSRGGHFLGTGASSSSRSSVVAEGIDVGGIAKLRRDVLERENQALAARLKDAETLNVKKIAECDRLQHTLDEKEAEEELSLIHI